MAPLKDVSTHPGQPSSFSVWNGATGERTMTNESGHYGKVHLRANRMRLREWLESHLEIQWGKRFVRYETQAEYVKVFFEDGSSATGDILVGADGINSRVRKQLQASTMDHVSPERLPLLGVLGEVSIDLDQWKRFDELGSSFYLADLPHGRFFGGVKIVTEDGAEAYWSQLLAHASLSPLSQSSTSNSIQC
jgi:2-polyprenyl-6-methoxyphenol hydroxylase-like FAD-dependent oxidoreductase